MKVYFGVYGFTNTGMSGADAYHYNLAMIMLSWGWEVRAHSQQSKEIHDIDGVTVYPTASDNINHHATNLEWCDIVITFPMPHKVCKTKKPLFILKHNDGHEPFDFSNDRIIYCGESVRKKLNMPCKASFIWHPVNRYAGTTARGNPDGRWIIVNCNDNKGGARLIELAKMTPDVKFAGVLGVYGRQIQQELPNLEYWPADYNMTKYYQQSAGLLSLSAREGFPTVVMEAMSHGLPIAGLHNEGVNDVAGIANRSFSGLKTISRWLSNMQPDDYLDLRDASTLRANELESSRDYEGLLNFLALK